MESQATGAVEGKFTVPTLPVYEKLKNEHLR
jgi:hypothetical protein